IPAATKIYRAIRALNPSVRIILGGPHVTLTHAAYKYEQKREVTGRAATAYRLLEEMFDVLVVGDGEIAVFDAMKDSPPKLVDGDDPKSDLFLDNQKLTELPFPARHLVDVDSYHYTIDGVRALSMIAQLGCPFGCGFCGGRMSPFLRRGRGRGPQNNLQRNGPRHQNYRACPVSVHNDQRKMYTSTMEHIK